MIISSLNCDVVIIGAGPSGTMAAALLAQQGVHAVVLEKSHFPRFVIGESLLPQSMEFIEKAGMLNAIKNADFQFKNGAAFSFGNKKNDILFEEKTAKGWATTFQVQRSSFDKILADQAEINGVEIRYGHEVTKITLTDDGAELLVSDEVGNKIALTCRFVVDASGYGRVLPRLLGLERPSDFPVRHALFTHISDQLSSKDFDRNKILITVHPKEPDIWYWLIPFGNGQSSIGVVATPERLATVDGDPSEKLWSLISETDELSALLSDAKEIQPVGQIKGYSCNVSQLSAHNFALLGNAGEFLDPVFSSGVTVALKSADLLIEPLLRQLNGEQVDWQKDFDAPLKVGVECFKAFVEAWYDGSLQKIIMNPPQGENNIKGMIVSVLAGYAWDEKNVFVTNPKKYLALVEQQCA